MSLKSKNINNSRISRQQNVSSLDWHDLIRNIPNEKVNIDKYGHYNPKESPSFHKWMSDNV